MNEVLTTEEAAALLKFKPATVRRLARERKIPARSSGRDWRFSRAALMRWLEGRDEDPDRADQAN
jgi:excisionase family DNA binding protein